MKNLRFIWVLIFACTFTTNLYAQTNKHHIAIFVPLYLDSAFGANDEYLYGKGFPRLSISGLEFTAGAEFALDSLSKEGKHLKVHIIDYKSRNGNLGTIAASPLMDSVEMIIAPANGADYLQIAAMALQKNIPFISATYPNDGGVRSNPNVIIVNAKLNTHLQATYNYVMRNLGTGRIIYVRRKNPVDDRIAEVFKELNQSPNGPVLRMETLLMDDVPLPEDLIKKIDSVRENVIIVGSVDENFGRNVASTAALLAKTNAVTLVGMPTWDGIKDLSKSEFKALPIIYSTSFFKTPGNKWGSSFEEAYRKKLYSKPSDVAYKGYEITWTFINLLLMYGNDLEKHLDDKQFNLLSDYDFRAIQWNKAATGPDYYENKRVYLTKRLNGVTTRLN
jgi:ABC-type branched-subunit amino acid transport system substrate-binding protein